MKVRNYTIFVFIFLFLDFVHSQQIIELDVNLDGYDTFEDYQDNLSKVKPTVNSKLGVNKQGALTYTIPIEVFKGVNSFQPNLALAYSSDNGNGQLGYGWNIIGLSLITEGGKVKNVDGINEGIENNNTNPLYLDGQRLINTSGTNLYKTEIYSTLKIKRLIDSEYSFEVKFPDGKVGKYVELANGQHSIKLMIDNYGNEIQYNYFIENNTPYLSTVEYGFHESNISPFKIEFLRREESRSTPVKKWKNGVLYINDKIINEIVVSSNQDGVFRRYSLEYDINSIGTERLRKVVVSNKMGDELKPLVFKYNDINRNEIEKKIESNHGLEANTKKIEHVISGNFFDEKESSSIYFQKVDDGYRITDSKRGLLNLSENLNNQTLFMGKIIGENGKLTDRDQILTINSEFVNDYTIDGNHYYRSGITFSFRDLLTEEENTITLNTTLGFVPVIEVCSVVSEQGDDAINYDYNDFNKYIDDAIVSDMNNDGLVDIVLTIDEQKGINQLPPSSMCQLSPENQASYYLTAGIPKKTYFIEIGKIINNTSQLELSSFEVDAPQLSNDGRRYLLDYDGNGFPDIMQVNSVSTERSNIDVFSIDFSENKIVNLVDDFDLNNFDFRKTPIIIGDFNGDGLSDFITPKKVLTIRNENQNVGDRLYDIIDQIENGTHEWWQYISNGNSFISELRDFTESKLVYTLPSNRNIVSHSNFMDQLWLGKFDDYLYTEYGTSTVIPVDYNNDGRTDLVSFSKFGMLIYKEYIMDIDPINKDSLADVNSQCYQQCSINCYANTGSADLIDCLQNCVGVCSVSEPLQVANHITIHENTYNENYDFNLISHDEARINLSDEKISPFSFFIKTTDNDGFSSSNVTLRLHDPNQRKDINFQIRTENFKENKLKSIDNSSGVVQQIEYTPLQKNVSCSSCSGDDSDNCNYLYDTESLDLPYPYYIHKQVPLKFMVSKVNTLFDEHTITKEYRYENAVQHLDGKGFLGFAKTYISDPYESKFVNNTYLPKNLQEPVFWKINKYDPLLENQLVETRYGELGGDYFTKSQMSYTKYMSSNAPNSNLAEHQYIYLSHQESNQDRTKNISTSKTYNYDESGDLLLLSSVTDYNGEGTSTTEIAYESPWSVGEHYFNGRILSHTETTNAYGSTFTTRDEYSDFNDAGIALTHDKSGNNTSEITTELTFDTFGNLSSERVSADGIASLTTTFSYDDSHRFVTSITNPEGQTATKTVDIHGRPLLETSAIDSNIKTHHTYDDWGNPLTSTTFYQTEIAQTTTLLKENIGNGYYTLTTTTPGTPQTIVTFDKFDRQVKVKTQSINGKWSVVDTEYDIFGKKTKVSEPYFDNESPTLWNTIAYDALDRPVEQVLYTGKVITTCYTGMTVTVDDGDQKTSKTLDVFGNVVQHKDYGGTINYDYFPNGTLKEADYDGVVIKIEQDGWGNKTRLEDPSAGVYEYSYDALGRKLSVISPKDSTVYTYDDYGKLLYEVREGENTHLFLQYEYNPSTKLPTKIYGSNGTDNFVYETKYDDYHRIEGKIETTPFFTYETTIALDDFGRPETFSTATTLAANAQTVTTQVRNFYDGNGLQTKLIDPDTGGILWELDQVNAKGQTTQMHWGNGYQINHGYDNFYMPQSIAHSRNSQTALSIDYQFDAQKGVLLSRNNYIFDKQENFEYDALYRLTREILNGSTLNEYGYDQRGRITYNSGLGEYSYNNTDYQIQKIGFNQQGQNLADNRGFHEIVYNGYKKAVSIHLDGKERLDFEYNPFGDRVAMYYGSEAENPDQRPLRRYYSSDKAVEITHNLQTGTIEVLTYLDGDPYSANVVERKLFSGSTGTSSERWYLHRDYQATILAISNSAGAILEQRYFDAWGNLKEYRDATGTLFVVTDEANINLILDRGYTGHEHLWGVDLIHMNGRLYDAKVRRFLSPDNFVQDPYNTQNFNRYTYVLNNPLLYTDSSGESVAIAVALAIAVKAVINIHNGIPPWYGLGKTAFIAAGSSMMASNIGSLSSAYFGHSTFVTQSLFQAGAHGISGGIMNELDGGNFSDGFWAGAVSSVVASGIRAAGIKFAGKNYSEGTATLNKFGNSTYMKAAMIAGGGLSGGISSSISGGDFWAGARQGLITSGLNHVMHGIANELSKPAYNNKSMTKWARKIFKDVKGAEDIKVKTNKAPKGDKYIDGGIYGKDEFDNYTKHKWGVQVGEKLYISERTYNQGMKFLYLVTGHELMHYSLELLFPAMSDNAEHLTIYDWEIQQLEKWGIYSGYIYGQSCNWHDHYNNKFPKLNNHINDRGWTWQSTGMKLIE